MTEDEEGHPTQGMAEVIVAKHRNGSLDSVVLKFIGKYTKFTDHETPSFSDAQYGTFDTVTQSSKANGTGISAPQKKC
jgi:replicative DNA helicase